jgi:hypothetical protein
MSDDEQDNEIEVLDSRRERSVWWFGAFGARSRRAGHVSSRCDASTIRLRSCRLWFMPCLNNRVASRSR